MAKERGSEQAGYWGQRPSAHRFVHTVSPLGADVEETPVYSPDQPVTGAGSGAKGRASRSGSAKDQRRGG